MAGFETVVKDLERTERELAQQLTAVRNALSSLRGGGSKQIGRSVDSPVAAVASRRRRRRLSADARRRISEAQKERWARQKAGKR